ncbi:N-acetyl-1-D-myo-inositol-2-amino-2-deoxy-alpha-D-glucopyranoside deacetylase [Cellulomonas sp.]|uniref:N-acetyl-1-D-myo-inositol-2-amino-2-deoxy-alpha- D-glucopyranoside deacetylase n=1 Tax=Cellulomonas sp. TaxID=40001 RepID=UPI001B29562B|nr:N-acetyl-1-D-myo-inositol-2-amino-2-deoxy-alpha-D-glucopyranoside deacetylase [Cellulomonas sp.]MBO9553359.1 N-acetyl-1-D-myo-inositol-2-amino-2-deoxy-alpha-D-glucopyranoside deacetylase [Cellulomonas sp.]
MRQVAGGLVAVHAHPDDESLATGALLATWAASGRPVTLVTCTRGERGEVIGDALAHLEGDGPALAAHRETELAGALAALGVTDHVFLDSVGPGRAHYEDSGMAWLGAGRAGSADDVPSGAFVAVPLDEAAARLAHVLRTRRPDVVVTYEPAGGYGHPDHVRAHDVTMRAVELATEPGDGLPGVRPLVLWAAQRAGALLGGRRALDHARVRAALGDARATLTLPGAELPSVAVPDDQVDLVVDVRPVRDRVLDALRAHATQVHAVRSVDGLDALVGCYALSNDVLAPVLPTEDYRVADGSSTAVVWPTGVRPVA